MLVKKIVGLEVPTDKTFTKKLKNLGLIMDAVGKFGDVLAKIGGMGGPTGDVAGTLKKTMVAILAVMEKGEGKGLPAVISAIGLEKFEGKYITTNAKKLTEMEKFMTAFKTGFDAFYKIPSNAGDLIKTGIPQFGKEQGAAKMIAAVGETPWKGRYLDYNSKKMGELASFNKAYNLTIKSLGKITNASAKATTESMGVIANDIKLINAAIESLPKASAKATITKFGKSIWTGSDAITLEHKPFVIKLEVKVEIGATKLAKALEGKFATAGK
jgi:hypothetical protein